MPIKEVLFGLAFLAVLVAAVGGFVFLPGYGSEGWPTTAGEVLSCDVRRTRSDDETRYTVELRYRYAVESITHEGFRMSFGGNTRYERRGSAEQRCAEYPVGSELTVYYQPEFPPNSTLKPGGTVLGPLLAYGGGVLAVLVLIGAMAATVWEVVQGNRERARLRKELGLDA